MTSPTSSLAARYGEPGAPLQAGPSNAVVENLLSHSAVRAYLDRPLEPGTLEMLVAAAQSAPTSSNMQAWSVVAVEDAERKARLATLAGNQGFIRQAPLFLCWIADLSRLERLGRSAGQRLEGLDYLESYMVALVDAAIAAQNALVAAESLGLGTVYVGALRNHPQEVAAELGLPPNAFAAFGLCVGWPDPARPAAVKPRLPQSLVLHRERYQAAAEEPATIATYDEALANFSESQGMGRVGWSGRMLKRVASAASLSGRDTMTATLKALGFGLR
ncbi:NADPH-dependent oxidoreductase [Roseomonas xinghualingensis]|uniref:NADPH-dependent oxidoreductase n=1 Tax=Roseomonas xinghualingensis TaxID=2986475 RepID=UPI0021F13B14|nr:NADPH-dependent oxidoreductase [Roseomonas sp. SXEYE001]MCV4206777.1 NADPH-dependent oxidoreductase [Roseomonas sp. SXEYE001]